MMVVSPIRANRVKLGKLGSCEFNWLVAGDIDGNVFDWNLGEKQRG